MGFKFGCVLLLVLALENGCQAGKGIFQVNQVRWQVVAAQQETKLAVDAANTTIQNNIAAAQTAIDNELAASQNRAAQVNNPQCANQHKAAIAQISSAAVKNCDQAAQFQAIELQVTSLNTIHAQLAGVYSLCPFWPPGNQALCIQNFCEGFATPITEQRDSILEAAVAASSDGAKCVADETQKAQTAISAADSALEVCSASASA